MKLKCVFLICMTALSSTLVAASQKSPVPNSAEAKQSSIKPQAPKDEFKMDAPTLGRLDAVLTVCAEADAKNRSRYNRYRTEMIVFGEGTPQEMRVEGSDTQPYKDAYAATVAAASKATKEDLVTQCSQMLSTEVAKKN